MTRDTHHDTVKLEIVEAKLLENPQLLYQNPGKRGGRGFFAEVSPGTLASLRETNFADGATLEQELLSWQRQHGDSVNQSFESMTCLTILIPSSNYIQTALIPPCVAKGRG